MVVSFQAWNGLWCKVARRLAYTDSQSGDISGTLMWSLGSKTTSNRRTDCGRSGDMTRLVFLLVLGITERLIGGGKYVNCEQVQCWERNFFSLYEQAAEVGHKGSIVREPGLLSSVCGIRPSQRLPFITGNST